MIYFMYDRYFTCTYHLTLWLPFCLMQPLPVLMVSSTQSVVPCAQGLVRIKTRTLCVLMSVLLVVSVLLGWFWRIMLAFNPLSVQVMVNTCTVCIVTLYLLHSPFLSLPSTPIGKYWFYAVSLLIVSSSSLLQYPLLLPLKLHTLSHRWVVHSLIREALVSLRQLVPMLAIVHVNLVNFAAPMVVEECVQLV